MEVLLSDVAERREGAADGIDPHPSNGGGPDAYEWPSGVVTRTSCPVRTAAVHPGASLT